MDDEFNILPLTKNIQDIKPVKLPGMKKKAGDSSGENSEEETGFKTEDLYLTNE
jgi:hypothetical protein